MKIKFLGQNCFLFTHQGRAILSDPFYNFQREKSGFSITEQKIDYMLISHAHSDHTADVKEVLENYPEATLIGQPEVCAYFRHSKSVDLNIGGSFKIGDLEVIMVNALHTSSFSDGAYGGVPSGYILRCGGKNLYLAGDTGVMAEMELFPKLFGEISLAILPIGGHYTMDAEMASFVAAELIKTPKVIGCHFDTFPVININHNNAKKYFSDRGVELVLPQPGMDFDF